MIDIIQQRGQEKPNQIFIKHKDLLITYKKFNNMISNAMESIHHIKLQHIGIQIHDKIKLLITINAINRLNKIPIIYPCTPNIKDYTNETNIPILIKDEDIIINDDDNSLNTDIEYNIHDTQLVMFTSGTTGKPKACELTYNNIYQSALIWHDIIHFTSKDIYLNHMPLTHVSGLCIFYRALYLNFIMAIDNFDAIKYNDYIKKYNITIISMVPSMLHKIVHANRNLNLLKNMKVIIMGGSNINNNLIEIINTYQLPVYMSYGMTETCSGIAGYWVGYANKYSPHNKVNINVEKSYLSIESPTVMKGYLNQQQTNNKIKTHDIGTIDDKNTFQVERRGDGTIISGGENISIQYIQKHIEKYPEIQKCTLKIVPDQEWGVVLHALIKCKNSINNNDLLKKLKKNLPHYMIPKRITIQ